MTGESFRRTAQVGHQEVMEGTLPAAHPGADRFLLDVLGERRALLRELGVEGCGQVAHGVVGRLVSFEEHLFAVFAEETEAFLTAMALAGTIYEYTLIRVVQSRQACLTGLPFRSIEYMSIMSSSAHPASSHNLSPHACGQILGEQIREARLQDGRPLEELAPLAGLTVAEWEAIEAGQVPDTWEQICLMATALQQDRSWRASLVHLCQGAWEK